MSAKHFQLLVVKALWDDDVRTLLFSRPEDAMKDFDLTKEGRAERQRMERERFEDLVVDYRLRLTKAALGPGAHVAFNCSDRDTRYWGALFLDYVDVRVEERESCHEDAVGS